MPSIQEQIADRISQRIDQEVKIKSLPQLPGPPDPTIMSKLQPYFLPSIPKSPMGMLPGLVPGASVISDPLKAGGKVIAENPAGAAKAIPAIAATVASVASGGAGLPLMAGALGVGSAAAGGSYLKNKALQALNSPDAARGNAAVGKDAAIEGALGAGSEALPAGIAAMKPYAKEFGLSAIDNIASLPKGSAASAYENTKVLAKGMAEQYLPKVKELGGTLAQLVKDATEKVKAKYGEAVAKSVAKEGKQGAIPAAKISSALDNLVEKAGVYKTGIQPGSEAVRSEVAKLQDDFVGDFVPHKLTPTKNKPLNGPPEIIGGIPLEKAMDLKQKLGEMADWVASTPGQGQQEAAIKETYGKIRDFIHQYHPEIANVDKNYKDLIDATSLLRQKLGIKPGEEATQASIEKIDTFIKSINNPGKKESVQEAVDTMAKSLGHPESVVKKAAEINAMKEFGPVFPSRRSINVAGKIGKLADVALTPVTGPRAMSGVLSAGKATSNLMGKIPGKTKIAQNALRTLLFRNRD